MVAVPSHARWRNRPFRTRPFNAGRPVSLTLASKNTNCDAEDSGEPDRQEAGRLQKRAASMLLGTQNQPEMATRRRFENAQVPGAEPLFGRMNLRSNHPIPKT